MAALNQEYFDRPESLRIAQGQSPVPTATPGPGDILGPDGRIVIPASNGGIEQPKAIEIPSGTTLIRFANAPFVNIAAAGGWWLDFPNYKIVEQYADDSGKPVQAAMRELCAVPEEWSSMTLLIQAVTRSPLAAYAGKGKSAVAQNRVSTVKTIDPLRYSRQQVIQYYIPGLQSPDLLKQALIVRSYTMVAPEVSLKGYNPELSIRR
jgi:hypothetical protein